MKRPLADRAKLARKEAKLTQTEAARQIGVSRAAVSQWENGETKTINSEYLHAAARVYAVSAEWLGSGRGEMSLSVLDMPGFMRAPQRDHLVEAAADEPSAIGGTVEIRGEVPLISEVPAGDFREAIDNFEPGDADDWLPCPVPHGKHTFAVQVSGESMKDEYPEGYIIFVDPDVPVMPGRDVVVRLIHSGRVTFKRYMEDGGKPYLKAMNRDWPNPIVPVDEDAEFCGVVIFTGKFPNWRG